jgi:hypothetical protein
MVKREIKTQEDLAKYLPREEDPDEEAKDPAEYLKNVDPELLDKLRHMQTDPDLLRPAPPSETAYVPPTALPDAAQDDEPTTRAEKRVELKLPRMSDAPTAPSLKRLEGEPEVPGVVKGPSAYAPSTKRGALPAPGKHRVSARTAALGALLGLVPVLLMIVVVEEKLRHPPSSGAESAHTAMEPAAPVPSVAATVATAVQPSAAPVTTAPSPSAPASASAVPSASATAEPAASPPAVGPHKTKPHATVEDPYGDASAPSPRKTAEPAPLPPPPTPPPPSAPPAPPAPSSPRWFP